MAVSLFLAEAVIRFLLPQQLIQPQAGLYEADSAIGWRFSSYADRIVNTGERPVRVVTDGDGFRINPEEAGDSSIDAHRVLAIGDSFLAGLQVQSEYTIPKVLESALRHRYGPDIEVINAGVDGWNPYQYAGFAARVARGSRFDLAIIFLYAGNDFRKSSDSLYEKSRLGRGHQFHIPNGLTTQAVVQACLYPINDYLEMHSHLFVLMRYRFRSVLAWLGITPYYFPDVFRLNEEEEDRWTYTFHLCRQISDTFEERKTPVIFVLLPTPYQVSPSIFDDYVDWFSISPETVDLELPNRKIADLFRGSGMVLVDVLSAMREQMARGADLYGHVDQHFSEAGHRSVANQLLPVVGPYVSVSAMPAQEEY